MALIRATGEVSTAPYLAEVYGEAAIKAGKLAVLGRILGDIIWAGPADQRGCRTAGQQTAQDRKEHHRSHRPVHHDKTVQIRLPSLTYLLSHLRQCNGYAAKHGAVLGSCCTWQVITVLETCLFESNVVGILAFGWPSSHIDGDGSSVHEGSLHYVGCRCYCSSALLTNTNTCSSSQMPWMLQRSTSWCSIGCLMVPAEPQHRHCCRKLNSMVYCRMATPSQVCLSGLCRDESRSHMSHGVSTSS